MVDGLAADRRVVLFDMLGFGLSAKPDRPYRLVDQADLAMALVADLGIDRLGLLTHDIGDTVGGELLARQLEGAWDVEVTDRVLTNGTLFMDLVQLSDGQQFLEALPDERLAPGVLDRDAVVAGLVGHLQLRATEVDRRASWTAALGADLGRRAASASCPASPATSRSAGSSSPGSPRRSSSTRPRWPWCGATTTPSPCRPWPTGWPRPGPTPGWSGWTGSGTTRWSRPPTVSWPR